MIDPVLKAEFDAAWSANLAGWISDAQTGGTHTGGYELQPVLLAGWCMHQAGHPTVASDMRSIADAIVVFYGAGGVNTIDDLQTATGLALAYHATSGPAYKSKAQALVNNWAAPDWNPWINFRTTWGYALDQAFHPAITALLLGWQTSYGDAIAAAWRDELVSFGPNGALIWDLGNFPPSDPGHTHGAADSSHSNRHILMAVLYYREGRVFSASHLAGLSKLLSFHIWNRVETVTDVEVIASQPWFSNYIDGDDSNYRGLVSSSPGALNGTPNGMNGLMYYGWNLLAAYDADCYDAMQALRVAVRDEAGNASAIINRNGSSYGDAGIPAGLVFADFVINEDPSTDNILVRIAGVSQSGYFGPVSYAHDGASLAYFLRKSHSAATDSLLEVSQQSAQSWTSRLPGLPSVTHHHRVDFAESQLRISGAQTDGGSGLIAKTHVLSGSSYAEAISLAGAAGDDLNGILATKTYMAFSSAAKPGHALATVAGEVASSGHTDTVAPQAVLDPFTGTPDSPAVPDGTAILLSGGAIVSAAVYGNDMEIVVWDGSIQHTATVSVGAGTIASSMWQEAFWAPDANRVYLIFNWAPPTGFWTSAVVWIDPDTGTTGSHIHAGADGAEILEPGFEANLGGGYKVYLIDLAGRVYSSTGGAFVLDSEGFSFAGVLPFGPSLFALRVVLLPGQTIGIYDSDGFLWGVYPLELYEPAQPGRGYAIELTTRDGELFGFAPIRRSAFVDGIWYRPAVVQPTHISSALSEPLSRVQQYDRIRVVIADRDRIYLERLLAGDRLDGAQVRVFQEIGGGFTGATDVIWTGFVRKHGGAQDAEGQLTLDCLDARSYYLDGVRVGPKRTVTDVAGSEAEFDDPDSQIGFAEGQDLPIGFGPFVLGPTAIRAYPYTNVGATTKYVYHDTLDARGGQLATVNITGHRVWLVDTKHESYVDLWTAVTSNLLVSGGAVHLPMIALTNGIDWTQSTVDAQNGELQIVKANVEATIQAALGDPSVTWDPERFAVLAKYRGPQASDPDLVAGYGAPSLTDDTGYPLFELAKLYVHYGNFPVSLLDLGTAAILDQQLPPVRRILFRGQERLTDLAASLLDEVGVVEYTLPDGRISWRRVSLTAPASRFTVQARHQVGPIVHRLNQWGDVFTSTAGARDHTLPWAPDKLLAQTGIVRDAAAVAANDGVDVFAKQIFKWLWDRPTMVVRLTEMLQVHGKPTELMTIRVHLDDEVNRPSESLSRQIATRPGDAIALSSEFASAYRGTWQVVAVRHDIEAYVSELTCWRLAFDLEAVSAFMVLMDGTELFSDGTAIGTTWTTGWTDEQKIEAASWKDPRKGGWMSETADTVLVADPSQLAVSVMG